MMRHALALVLSAGRSVSDPALPTPYTPDQIRRAMPEGTCLALRVDGPPGASPTQVLLRWRVVRATSTRMVWETLAASGDPNAPPVVTQRSSARWTELQAHASFSAADSTRARAVFDTPFGPLEGWRYVVAREGGETTYEFADAMPGPPVRIFRRGADGVTEVTTQVERGPCPPG